MTDFLGALDLCNDDDEVKDFSVDKSVGQHPSRCFGRVGLPFNFSA